MKNPVWLALSISLLLVYSCHTDDQPARTYRLEIALENAPDSVKAVISYQNADDEEVKVDSLWLIEGQGSIEHPAPVPVERMRVNIPGLKGSFGFFAEPGTITFRAPADSLQNHYASGTPLNDKMLDYFIKRDQIRTRLRMLVVKYNEAGDDTVRQKEIVEEYRKTFGKQDSLVKVMVARNTDNIIAPVMTRRLYRKDSEYALLDSTLRTFDSTVMVTTPYRQLVKMLNAWKNLQEGMIAPDFSQTDSTGQVISLSDFRGKYLLVDFWASWCGPCRAENPNIVAAYNKFKSRNFDILGVSLDTDRDKWLAAIAKDGLTWHHVSDLQGWDNRVSRSYGIHSIPYSLLLSPEGRVIGKDLRGAELHNKLEEVLPE